MLRKISTEFLYKPDSGGGASGGESADTSSSGGEQETSGSGVSSGESSRVDSGVSGAEGSGSVEAGGEKDSSVPSSWEEIFKHPRFKQLVQRSKQAEAELDRLKKEEAEAEKSRLKETEQYKELYEKAEKDLETASTRLTESERKFRNMLIRSEALQTATVTGFADPRDALQFLDLDEVGVSDEWEVDSKAVKSKIEKLAEEKPYLLKKTKSRDPGVPPTNSNLTPDSESLEAARRRQESFTRRNF